MPRWSWWLVPVMLVSWLVLLVSFTWLAMTSARWFPAPEPLEASEIDAAGRAAPIVRVLNLLQSLLTYVCGGALALGLLIELTYSAVMPREPDPLHGRVHPFTVMRHLHVLVTEKEARLGAQAGPVLLISICSALGVMFLLRWVVRRVNRRSQLHVSQSTGVQ
jgi:hypothetical protein